MIKNKKIIGILALLSIYSYSQTDQTFALERDREGNINYSKDSFIDVEEEKGENKTKLILKLNSKVDETQKHRNIFITENSNIDELNVQFNGKKGDSIIPLEKLEIINAVEVKLKDIDIIKEIYSKQYRVYNLLSLTNPGLDYYTTEHYVEIPSLKVTRKISLSGEININVINHYSNNYIIGLLFKKSNEDYETILESDKNSKININISGGGNSTGFYYESYGSNSIAKINGDLSIYRNEENRYSSGLEILGGHDKPSNIRFTINKNLNIHNFGFPILLSSKSFLTTKGKVEILGKDIMVLNSNLEIDSKDNNTNISSNILTFNRGKSNIVLDNKDESSKFRANLNGGATINLKKLEEWRSTKDIKSVIFEAVSKDAAIDEKRGIVEKGVINITLKNGSTWNILEDSDITTLNNESGIVSLGNGNYKLPSGEIKESNIRYEDNLTIEGDYKGETVSIGKLSETGSYDENLKVIEGIKSTIRLNTLWNETETKTDTVNIKGSASGITRVIPIGSDGKENIVDGSISELSKESSPVITVGTKGEVAFVGVAKTTGASELLLVKRNGENGVDKYVWTVTRNGKPIYDPITSIYESVNPLNLENAYNSISTFHERKGEVLQPSKVYARVFGNYGSISGKNHVSMNYKNFGISAMYDIVRKESNVFGGILTYTSSNSNIQDRFREKVEVGKISVDSIGIGLNNTWYSKDGTYFDVLGQYMLGLNKIKTIEGLSNEFNSHTLSLSLEVGKPFKLKNNIILEPQAQLIYSMQKTSNVNFDNKEIKFGINNGLRARLGLRIAKVENDKTYYLRANIWHDILKKSNISIGKDKLEEEYGKTWIDLEAGGQYPINKNTYIYSNVKFSKGIDKSNYFGIGGTLGIKYRW